jgi:hypothetical protein
MPLAVRRHCIFDPKQIRLQRRAYEERGGERADLKPYRCRTDITINPKACTKEPNTRIRSSEAH